MKNLKISDGFKNKNNVLYVYNTLCGLFKRTGTDATAIINKGRACLSVDIKDDFYSFIKAEIEDKIADVIAINYKYVYLKKLVNPYGLNDFEKELLITALISADIDDDKKYVINKIGKSDDTCMDGTFNFRMVALKEKWKEVAGYIPAYFRKEDLKNFITYLVGEKRGKRVFVEGGGVYDRHFNKLSRCFLTDGNLNDGYIIREILLSGGGEVELSSEIPEKDRFYLKEYYGNKIFFRKGFFS